MISMLWQSRTMFFLTSHRIQLDCTTISPSFWWPWNLSCNVTYLSTSPTFCILFPAGGGCGVRGRARGDAAHPRAGGGDGGDGAAHAPPDGQRGGNAARRMAAAAF